MRNQKMKIMTGTMISLLLSAVTVYPALARPVVEPESKQTQSVEEVNTTAKGTIQSINGNVVTLKMSDGMTQSVTLKQEDVRRLNLQPGMQISVTVDKQNTASEVSLIEKSSDRVVRGMIKSITGNMVMLEMPDGMTTEVTLEREDITRLKLEPGMEISFMLDDDKMASEVSVVQASTTATGSSSVDATTSREVTTQRRTTVETVRTPVMDSTTTPTTSSTDEVTETTETQEVEEAQSTEARPVRALW